MEMWRRIVSGLAACCVFLTHAAAFGHAHAVQTHVGHDARPHLHLSADAEHRHVHGDHSHGHRHHRHEHGHRREHGEHGRGAASEHGHERASAAAPDSAQGGSPCVREPAEGHDHDAVYLDLAAGELRKGAANPGPAADVGAATCGPAAFDGGCGLRGALFRPPPRFSGGALPFYLLHSSLRC